MFELMDDISELVYVSDPETYELLYVNDRGKLAFGLDRLDGRTCYEALQGASGPCAFCTNHLLSDSSTYTWEHYNPITGRSYLLKDRLIDWEGRKVRLEVAFDITEQTDQRKGLEAALGDEQLVMHCVECLHQATDLTTGIADTLARLGQALSAERAYIFQLHDGQMSNTFEWCANGVTPQIGNLQAMDDTLLRRWLPYFHSGECMILEDLDQIRDTSPDEYAILSAQNIQTLVAAPLEEDGRLTGFVGVDNPVLGRMYNIATVLTTLRYFLMTTMRRLQDEQQLTVLSFQDTLTGLYNRNRYTQDLVRLEGYTGPLGVLYMDLNGLKEINDAKGHAAGDLALVYCAEALRQAFPHADRYRIGGDEFVVLAPGLSRAEFDASAAHLRSRFTGRAAYRTAIGVRWVEQPVDLDGMILAADTDMYDDKRRFYRSHSQSTRYRKFREEDAALSKGSVQVGEYNALMSSMGVSVSKHLLREDFPVVWANDYFFTATGYTREEYEQLFHGSCAAYFAAMPEEYQRMTALVLTAFREGKPGYEAVVHMPVKGGGAIWVRLTGRFTDEALDGVPMLYASYVEVSDLVRAQQELESPYDSLPGFVVKLRVTADSVRLLYGNHRFTQLFGSAAGGRPLELLREDASLDWMPLTTRHQQLRAGVDLCFLVTARDPRGGERTFQAEAACVEHLAEDPVYLITFTDVTAVTAQQKQLYALAYTDPVTGGRNRARFELDAGAAVAAAPAGTYVLASLDVQKFKVINDLFGIAAGDETLRYLYRRIAESLGPGEYVGRISSDSFTMLLHAAPEPRLERRIALLAKSVNAYNRDRAHKYYLILSVGICPVDDPALSMLQYQDRANLARKKSKHGDMSQLHACRFYSRADQRLLARETDIENRMHDALRGGQFVVHYQPKQDLRTGNIAGAEALVRWQDPKAGLIPPDQFIPLFERNGFIVQLDLYVFEQACALLARWLTQGRRAVPISVNMSRVHFASGAFLRRYEDIRRRYGVPASLLEIEVTETLVFENPQLFASIIDEIHRRGYHCSMDDFGSGYSSLATLKNIRVDTLKLDKAFFSSEQLTDPWEAAIVSGVVSLARRLQMRTVAEGVETPQQADFLREAGCDMIQGFLFSRPLPEARMEELLLLT